MRRRALQLSCEQLARRAALPVETLERVERGDLILPPSQAYRLGLALQLKDPVAFAEQTVTLLLFHPQYLLEHLDAGAA